MNQYNISTEEIAKVISLYSKITNSKKRLYAQGYLDGLGAATLTDGIFNDDTKASNIVNSGESQKTA